MYYQPKYSKSTLTEIPNATHLLSHYNHIWVSDKGRELLSSDLHDVDGVVEDGTVVVGDTREPADGGRARGLL